MAFPVSPHDSQIGSFANLFAGGSLGMALLSAVGSIIAYGMLPAQIRIHWTLGMGPYYGPEFAPTVLILILFPVLIAGTAVLASSVDVLLDHSAEFAAIRPYYVVAMFGTLGILLSSHILVIVANLSL